MKKHTVVATAWVAILLLGGSAGAQSPPGAPAQKPRASEVRKINDPASLPPAETKKLMDSRKDLVLVDVRSPLEFSQGFIKGSQNIPFIDIMEGRHALPKDRPVLMICSIGGRSFAAVQLLQEKGYKEVYNLDGGIEAWQHARFPVAHP